MAKQPSTDKAGPSNALQRGKACLRCRKRKMKCDGAKPACQQCVRARKEDCCEYDDGKGKTRTQLLKETISRLENRVRQLEEPSSNGIPASVVLFEAHDGTYSGSSTDSFDSPDSSSFLSAYPDSSASPAASWSQMQGSASPLLGAPSLHDMFFDERHSPFSPSNDVSVMLLDIFAPHAQQCGLEMDMEGLRQSIALPNITDQRHTTFLNAIYLWACFISRPEPLSQNEEHYLRLSLESMPDALQTGKFVDAIRASCLLSLYFLSIGRLAEGTYHASAAAALADQLGLGKQCNAADVLDMKSFKSEIQEAEQLLAFWQVYNLDRCWSVVLQKHPVIADGLSPQTMITAPWPQEISEYKIHETDKVNQGHASNYSQGPTIQGFLSGSIEAAGFSSPALRVKASSLLSQADRLAGEWYPGMKVSAKLVEDINKLEHAIALFLSTLMPIDQLDKMLIEEKHILLVPHTLAQTAVVFLHRLFAAESQVSMEKCAQASRICVSMIKTIGEKEFIHLDPIVGPCWSWIADNCISRLDNHERTWPLSDTTEVIDELASLIYAMNQLCNHFPFINPALSRVQKRLA